MTEKFSGLQYPLVKGQHGLLAKKSRVDQIKADLLQLLLTNPGERCLTEDTKIPLVNGEEIAIKDLIDRDDFWVYSYDFKTDSIVAGKAKAYMTVKNAELIEVTLDNNLSVRCTPNHLWLLRDGTYKRTDELCVADSLMPLYRRFNTSGYEMIYQPYLKDYKETHSFVIQDRLRQKAIKQFENGHPSEGRKHTDEAKQKMKKLRPSMVGNGNPSKRPEVREKLKLAWERRRQNNHKVLIVKKLDIREDCYDLHVQEYHNFAISAGVFVHNCMLPEFGVPLRRLVFEPNDTILEEEAIRLIGDAISIWEPRIVVTQLTVTSIINPEALSANDTGDDVDHILGINIEFIDPQNISQVEALKIELPLGQ